MKKQISVVITVIMIVTLVLLIMTGCNSATNSNNEADPIQKPTEIPTETSKEEASGIRVIVTQIANVATDRTSYIEEIIEKELNIRFIKTASAADRYKEKMNAMMASGSLDLVGLTNQEYFANAEKGYLLDLTDVITSEMPNYNAILSDEVREKMSIRGKVYGVSKAPNFSVEEPTLSTSTRLSIRTDWLEELDLEVPQTIDEVLNVAKAFYDADLGGVGKENLSIITACNGFSYLNLDWVFGAYGVMYNMWYLGEDGKIASYDVQPGMKEALQWLASAYKEGLLDKEFFTQREPQMKVKIINNGVGIWGGHWGTLYSVPWPREHEEINLKREGKLKADEEYIYEKGTPFLFWDQIDPPKGPKGESGYRSVSGTELSGICAIPKNANKKAIEGVIRFLDFMSTKEATILCGYGVEDIDFTMTDNGPIPGPAVGDKEYTEYKLEKGIGHNVGGIGENRGTYFYPIAKDYEWASMYNTRKAQYGEYAAEQIVKKASEWANPKYVDIVSLLALVSPSTSQTNAKLVVLRDEYFGKIVYGEYDIDKFDAFVDEWHSSGGEDLTKEYNYMFNTRK